MKIAVIRFPGSNCDLDLFHALKTVLKADAEYVWWGKKTLEGYDAAVISGGFSFGDYLRAGAIARFTPVMEGIAEFAKNGKPVLGICNGFQVLTEAGILPGALMHNKNQKFICEDSHLRVETSKSMFTGKIEKGSVLRMPIAHMEGRYVVDDITLKALEDNDRVLLRYCGKDGKVEDGANVNGSANSIAGVLSAGRNVAGIMPHPERACEKLLGGEDGKTFLKSFLSGAKG